MAERTVDILLVEDNPNDVELAMHAFRKNGVDGTVHAVRDGVEAVEFLFCTDRYAGRDPSSGPKLILLDLKLPKLDGLELLQRIKSDNRTKKIPVVVLTTSHERSDVEKSYLYGANSYVRKPVNFEEFAEAIRLIIQYWFSLNQSPFTL